MHSQARRLPTLLSIVLLLLLLSACGFIPALPARDPGPTPTPLVTEGIAGSHALAYNLGTANITQSWSAESPQMTVPLLGAISMPEGDGPFPVALVLHGRHTRCYSDAAQLEEAWPCAEGAEPRYDIGFSYLLDALAAEGYLAVAPSVNGAYTTTYDLGQGSLDEIQPRIDERMTQIVSAHLAELGAANDGQQVFAGGLDLAGKVEPAAVYVVAHSTSGVTTNLMAGEGQLPVRAQLLLTPMNFSTTGATADVPTVVVVAVCDGDSPALPGQTYYESARQGPRAAVLSSVYLPGANHNFFNQALVRQGIDDGLFTRNPVCPAARLSAEDQQAFIASLAADFFGAVRGGETPTWLSAVAPVTNELFGREVITALSPPSTQRRTLLSGEASLDGPIEAELCAAGEPCADGLFQPGQPDSVRLSWSGEGATFTLGAGDITESYDVLRLRAALDPTHALNDSGEPVSFSVVLTDRAGNTAEMLLPQPLPVVARGTYEGDDFRYSPVLATEARWPLTDFAGVDTAALESVTLRFDGNRRGSVLLLDLDLLRGP